MTHQDEQLGNIIRRQTPQKPAGAVRLGDTMRALLEGWISPQQARFDSIHKLLARLLPAEVRSHCKITDVSGGQLKVQVDLPSYIYELQLCSSELLKELRRRCPQARIKKIKFVVG